MQCRTHPTTSAYNTCNQCGDWLCEECTVDVQGRLYCRGCLTKMATPTSVPYPAPTPVAPGGRRILWGILLMFSLPPFPPGVNYLFMGLIKKGLAALCAFFLLAYLIGVTSGPLSVLFGLAMPVFWLTVAFDGFNIRRRLRAGEHVPDSIDEVVTFLRGNKYVLWVILGLIGLSVLGSVVGIVFRLISWAMPVIIIGIGLLVLFRRKNPPGPPTPPGNENE